MLQSMKKIGVAYQTIPLILKITNRINQNFIFFGKLFPDDFFKKHPYYVISFIVDKFTGEYLPHPKGFPDDFLCFYSLNDYGYVAFSRGNNLESLCKKVAESISKKINTNQITRAYSIICVDIPKITTSNVTEKPICLNFELENNYNITKTLSNIFGSKLYSIYHFGQIDKTFKLKKLRKEELAKLFDNIDNLPNFKIDYQISLNNFVKPNIPKSEDNSELNKIADSIRVSIEKLDNIKIYFEVLSNYILETLEKNEINSNYLSILNAYFHVYDFLNKSQKNNSLNIIYYTKPLYEAFINNNQSLLRNNYINFPKSSYIPTKIVLFYTIFGELFSHIILNYNLEMSEEKAILTSLEKSTIRSYKSSYQFISQNEISSFFITANDLPTQLITWPNKDNRKEIYNNYMYYNLSLSNWKRIKENLFFIAHELSHNVGQIYRLREIRYGLLKEFIINFSTINLFRMSFALSQKPIKMEDSPLSMEDYNDFFEAIALPWEEGLREFIEINQQNYFRQSNLENNNIFLLKNCIDFFSIKLKDYSQIASRSIKKRVENLKNNYPLYSNFLSDINPEFILYSFSSFDEFGQDIEYLFHECFADFIAFLLIKPSLNEYIHFYSKTNDINKKNNFDKSLDFYRIAIVCIVLINTKNINIQHEKSKITCPIDKIIFEEILNLKEKIETTDFSKIKFIDFYQKDDIYPYLMLYDKLIIYLYEVNRNMSFYLSKLNDKLYLLRAIFKTDTAEEAIQLLFKKASSLSFVYEDYHNAFIKGSRK